MGHEDAPSIQNEDGKEGEGEELASVPSALGRKGWKKSALQQNTGGSFGTSTSARANQSRHCRSLLQPIHLFRAS